MTHTTWSIDKPLVLDTDVLSCFLLTAQEGLLVRLYPQAIILDVVYAEIQQRADLRNRLDPLLQSGWLKKDMFDTSGNAAREYAALISNARKPSPLGRGEAAVMAWVRYHGGTIASNNLKDVYHYCDNHHLPLMTIRAIIAEAVLNRDTLSQEDAENFWQAMIKKRRRLPCSTAEEAIQYYLDHPELHSAFLRI